MEDEWKSMKVLTKMEKQMCVCVYIPGEATGRATSRITLPSATHTHISSQLDVISSLHYSLYDEFDTHLTFFRPHTHTHVHKQKPQTAYQALLVTPNHNLMLKGGPHRQKRHSETNPSKAFGKSENKAQTVCVCVRERKFGEAE